MSLQAKRQPLDPAYQFPTHRRDACPCEVCAMVRTMRRVRTDGCDLPHRTRGPAWEPWTWQIEDGFR